MRSLTNTKGSRGSPRTLKSEPHQQNSTPDVASSRTGEVETAVNEVVFQVGLMEVQLNNAINGSAHGKELLLPNLRDYKAFFL